MTMTADTLAAPRTRKKGKNLEKWGWIYMRVSGVFLVVLIFGHLFVNLMVGEGISAIDFGFVAGKLANPFWQWYDFFLLVFALIHGGNGMRTIVNDYVTSVRTRKVLETAIWVAVGFLIVLGTLVLFTFDPCLGFDPETASDTIIGLCE